MDRAKILRLPLVAQDDTIWMVRTEKGRVAGWYMEEGEIAASGNDEALWEHGV